MKLPPEDRAELADSLLSSLEQSGDKDASTAWRIEVLNRLEELDSGQVEAVSGNDLQHAILFGMLIGTQ